MSQAMRMDTDGQTEGDSAAAAAAAAASTSQHSPPTERVAEAENQAATTATAAAAPAEAPHTAGSAAPAPPQPPAAAAADAVHPSMLIALRQRLSAGRARREQLRAEHAHLDGVIQHSFRLLTSRHDPPACACASAVKTVFDTTGAQARPAVASAPSNSFNSGAASDRPLSASPPTRFNVCGLSIRALQTFLSVSHDAETWSVSAQIAHAPSGHSRTFSQLKLTLAHAPSDAATPLPQLITHTRGIDQLAPGQTACLSIQLHGASLPTTTAASTLAVGLSWLHNKQAVETHTIGTLTLPRWAAHGQHQLLIHPDATIAPVDLPQPLLSISDQAHRLDLLVKREERVHSGVVVDPSSEQLRSLLMQHFAWIEPTESDRTSLASLNAFHALDSLRHSSLTGTPQPAVVLCGDIRTRAPFSRLSARIAGSLSLAVFAPSASDLLRFAHALQQYLIPLGLTAVCDSSSTRVQTGAQQLLDAMQRENDGQTEALKRHFPAVFAHHHTGTAAAAAAASCNPQSYLQYAQEAMQLQITTDEAAARAAALL